MFCGMFDPAVNPRAGSAMTFGVVPRHRPPLCIVERGSARTPGMEHSERKLT